MSTPRPLLKELISSFLELDRSIQEFLMQNLMSDLSFARNQHLTQQPDLGKSLVLGLKRYTPSWLGSLAQVGGP